jgi:hypothetical protein
LAGWQKGGGSAVVCMYINSLDMAKYFEQKIFKKFLWDKIFFNYHPTYTLEEFVLMTHNCAGREDTMPSGRMYNSSFSN